jgi:hypothetical protein
MVYSQQIKLKLNEDMLNGFSTKCGENFLLSCGQRTIEKVDACRYLGVVIDDKLKWTSHIDRLYSKLMKFTSSFL